MEESEIVEKDVDREKNIYTQIVKKNIDSEKNKHCGNIDSVKKNSGKKYRDSGKNIQKTKWKKIYRQ